MGTPWEVPVPRKVRCIKKSGGAAIFGRVGYASFGIGGRYDIPKNVGMLGRWRRGSSGKRVGGRVDSWAGGG